VIHAVRNEFARSLADFIARRTAMTWRAPAAAASSAPKVARLMAQELGWSLEREQHELEIFEEYLNHYRLHLNGATSSQIFTDDQVTAYAHRGALTKMQRHGEDDGSSG
jgi:glycerol-3-phosphate dehydrogenase